MRPINACMLCRKLQATLRLYGRHICIEVVNGAGAGDVHGTGSTHNSRAPALEREDLLANAHGSANGVYAGVNIDRDSVRAGPSRGTKLVSTATTISFTVPNLLDDHRPRGHEHSSHEDQVVIVLVASRFRDGIATISVFRVRAIVIDEFFFL